MIFLKKMIYYL